MANGEYNLGMCYRVQQTWPTTFEEQDHTAFEDLFGMLFGIEEPPTYVRASNIAPTDQALVVPNTRPRKADYFRFFLIPSFAKDRKYYDLTLGNARDDKILGSKLYGQSFRKQRCIVPVSGYYEFKKTGEKKTDPKVPYVFYVKEQPMFGLAGIWDTWRDPVTGEVLNCFAIITTEPNALAAQIHNRMPAILERENYEQWLDPGEPDPKELLGLLKPYPAEKMARREFAKVVNNSKNKDEATLVPVGEMEMI
jgi:putative SOS response-associated peptidase YedK